MWTCDLVSMFKNLYLSPYSIYTKLYKIQNYKIFFLYIYKIQNYKIKSFYQGLVKEKTISLGKHIFNTILCIFSNFTHVYVPWSLLFLTQMQWSFLFLSYSCMYLFLLKYRWLIYSFILASGIRHSDSTSPDSTQCSPLYKLLPPIATESSYNVIDCIPYAVVSPLWFIHFITEVLTC